MLVLVMTTPHCDQIPAILLNHPDHFPTTHVHRPVRQQERVTLRREQAVYTHDTHLDKYKLSDKHSVIGSTNGRRRPARKGIAVRREICRIESGWLVLMWADLAML
jgi:hypothetical protein